MHSSSMRTDSVSGRLGEGWSVQPPSTPPAQVHAGIHAPPAQVMLGYTPPTLMHAGIHTTLHRYKLGYSSPPPPS